MMMPKVSCVGKKMKVRIARSIARRPSGCGLDVDWMQRNHESLESTRNTMAMQWFSSQSSKDEWKVHMRQAFEADEKAMAQVSAAACWQRVLPVGVRTKDDVQALTKCPETGGHENTKRTVRSAQHSG